MKYTENDKLRAQTIRLGDQIAVLFKQKKPLLKQQEKLDLRRKVAVKRGQKAISIRIGDQMSVVGQKLNAIDKKIAPLELSCYQNYRILTGN